MTWKAVCTIKLVSSKCSNQVSWDKGWLRKGTAVHVAIGFMVWLVLFLVVLSVSQHELAGKAPKWQVTGLNRR